MVVDSQHNMEGQLRETKVPIMGKVWPIKMEIGRKNRLCGKEKKYIGLKRGGLFEENSRLININK